MITPTFKNKQDGFTLIELLIVVSIIALLATLGLINYQEAQKNTRNSKRKADLKAVQAALETYFIDNRRYPEGPQSSGCAIIPPTYIRDMQTLPAPSLQIYPTYITRLPSDPWCGRTGATQYRYQNTGTGYILTATLGADCPNPTAGGVRTTDEFRSTLGAAGDCLYEIRR